VDKADASERSQEAEVGRLTRREWELTEKVIELENALASRIERDEIREMEIRSLRSELELKTAYSLALEQQKISLEELSQERMQHIEWLRSHLDHLVSIPALAPMLSEQDARAALLAERQRISYRMVKRLSRHRRLFDPVRAALRLVSPRRGRSDPTA
jgi:hypothetical protein